MTTDLMPGAGQGRLVLGLAAGLSAFALLIAACGGDSDDDTAPPPTAAPATATPGATGQADSADATAGSTDSTGATGGTGPAAAGGTGSSLPQLEDYAGLDSFRWDVSITGAGSLLSDAGLPALEEGAADEFSAHGAYIAPDQAQVEVTLAGLRYRQTIKGNQQWTSIAGVMTGPEPAASAAESLIYVTAFIDPATTADETAMQCGGTETVNGIQSVRCEATDAEVDQVVASLAGEGAQADAASFVLWIASEGNFVVKYDFNASGAVNGEPFDWSFVANITDVNNVPAIEP